LIRLLAPAKVNLNLRVLGVRPDGYHEIESLVQKISLYDRITLTKEDQPRIRVVCATPGIPTGPENLVYRAAALLMEAPGFKGKGVTILLEKHIPQSCWGFRTFSGFPSGWTTLRTLRPVSVPMYPCSSTPPRHG
jgi:4-diphosphocytidyl-2-C-methyl-D-erythritol kinase